MGERENVVDFTVPFYDVVGFQILMKRWESEPHIARFAILVGKDVWWSLVLGAITYGVVLWTFDKWSPYSYQETTEILEIPILDYFCKILVCCAQPKTYALILIILSHWA